MPFNVKMIEDRPEAGPYTDAQTGIGWCPYQRVENKRNPCNLWDIMSTQFEILKENPP